MPNLQVSASRGLAHSRRCCCAHAAQQKQINESCYVKAVHLFLKHQEGLRVLWSSCEKHICNTQTATAAVQDAMCVSTD